MSIEEMYSFVTNPKTKMQGIAIKQGKYFGVIYEYNEVNFGKVEDDNLLLDKNEDGEVILSFQYNILDRYGFDNDEFSKKELNEFLEQLNSSPPPPGSQISSRPLLFKSRSGSARIWQRSTTSFSSQSRRNVLSSHSSRRPFKSQSLSRDRLFAISHRSDSPF